jgi:dolichol-phosphate mannosyltransferase
MNIAIIIPAYNEETRIAKTLYAYHDFFIRTSHHVDCIVVLNGCTDQTEAIVADISNRLSSISYINVQQAGKGLAIKCGFAHALQNDSYDCIGFVDADMATNPHEFNKLINNISNVDGVIASRYMPGAHVYPPRSFIKRCGSRLVYEPLVRLLFGLSYYDLQCGAKLFKYNVVKKITPLLSITQWAFDVELLYLCKQFRFIILEVPTSWFDQTDSKLKISSGFMMLGQLVRLRLKYLNVKLLT